MKKLIFLLLLITTLFFIVYTPKGKPIFYRVRESKKLKKEVIAGENWIRWLYYNPFGKLSLDLVVKKKFLSKFYGKMMDSKKSTKKIRPFIEDMDIDMSFYNDTIFSSFNHFFARKIKPSVRVVDTANNILVSPADGKLLAFTGVDDFLVKGFEFDILKFTKDKELSKIFLDGDIVIIRLSPTDYHRFHFPISGKISLLKKINGNLYSVSPLALSCIADIFLRNKREFVVISSRQFGKILMAEVGATMVGSIVQTYKGKIAVKGEEKGFFKFGGSSIVLIFEKGKIEIDKDLLQNTKDGFETFVRMGERIAKDKEKYKPLIVKIKN